MSILNLALGKSAMGLTGAVLHYPVSATAAEKSLRHKGQESFPSWTSPVRPRSITVGRRTYLVEPVNEIDAFSLPFASSCTTCVVESTHSFLTLIVPINS